MVNGNIHVPDVIFSNWAPWDNRNDIEAARNSGIYVLAHYANPPGGAADPVAQEVVYIGETHKQTLRTRLQAFNRSATDGRPSHAGGVTYNAIHDGVGDE